ncbi:MAG TPA: type II toxin-antitoxin system VapB family antitoxin [Ramlibacter sp.]|jgi:hypothetical protein|nr:type II toxin-antitoxin system VapB family antitoxin [Ramlibacter sp.]
MLTNIDIDEDLIAQAMQVSGARSKREAVDRALREMVARARRPRFRDFYALGGIDPDYDPKASSPEEFGKNRVEQPRASYKLPASTEPAKRPPRKIPPKP